MSIRDPMILVSDRSFDYRSFDKFSFAPGQYPDYLQTEYGLPAMGGRDLKRLLSDWSFVDSMDVTGVQVADLLVSAANRCFRGNFDSVLPIARSLGALMLQRSYGRAPAIFVTLSKDEVEPDVFAESAARAMLRSSKHML